MKIKSLDTSEVRELKLSWEKHFVPENIDSQSIYLDCYLWHVFSYEKAKCFIEEVATDHLNSIEKKDLYIFYQHVDTGYLLEDIETFLQSDVQNLITTPDTWDIYVTDGDFRWTYIETHEGDCGPYFALKTNE